jgi:thiol-disulfide isomerase/thioredoxin
MKRCLFKRGFSLGLLLLPVLPVLLAITPVQAQVQVGEKAKPISMSNPEGETLSLKDLRGQLVLIDFWASWCGPCRRENPTLVRLYKRYNDRRFMRKGEEVGQGFTIMSVSLDKNKSAWTRAIRQDGLIWDYHVSDLQGWGNEAAQAYGVNSIPQSFLVDDEGNIIAKRIRGPQLEGYLSRMAQ